MIKKGMSLIALAVTVIVMSIIAFAVVISLNNSTDEAKEVGFATEVKEIMEASQAYYIQHGKLPVVDEISYTKADLLGMSTNSQKLQNEIDINKDTTVTYYKIDLNKIARSGSLYGSGKKSNDFYVISGDGNFVYYPLGVKINGNIYFSFTSELAQISDIEITDNAIGDVVSIMATDKIVISKNTEKWTNTLDLTVNTALASGQKLYYIIGSVKTEITASLPYTLTLSNSTIASSSTLANAVTQNEYIVFQKESSAGNVIAKTTIDIKNLDINAPIVGTTVVKKYPNYVLVEFVKATDDKSGIGLSYYTVETTDYTATQLLLNGDKGDKYSIRLDSDATSLQFILVDNAGNMSGVQNINIE